jgi:hypothetical protein
MKTQLKHYGRYLEPAKKFAKEINEIIKLNFTSEELQDKTYKKIIFKDENNNDWEISKDYSLDILEITILCKMIVNNKPRYKSGWAYNKVNTNFDTHHLIQIENLYFHIFSRNNLLL